MDLRNLRCFMAVAEELHFARAAERLHIEQSPLSRTIKDLESDLGARLFNRSTRGTQLTPAGQVLLETAPRVFAAVEQARQSVRAAACGQHGTLRIALSDGVLPQRLASLLALCRQEEPDVDIRLFEVPLAEQLSGLHRDMFDAGFARATLVDEGICAEVVWQTPLTIALPPRHPLLVHKHIPLAEALNFPLVLFHPERQAGLHQQISSLLRTVDTPPLVAEHVASQEVMLALVAAGYGVGLACEAQVAAQRMPEVVTRPLAGEPPLLTTYLLRAAHSPGPALARFITRVMKVVEQD